VHQSVWAGRLDGGVLWRERCVSWKEPPKALTWQQYLFELRPVYLKARKALDPHSKMGHAGKMEGFYAPQVKFYDATRESLQVRRILAEMLPLTRPKDGRKLVMIDVGCGTGRFLEHFPVHVIREAFEAIILCDVSDSMLKAARARVRAAGLQDIVHCMVCDFSCPEARSILPPAGSVDIITFCFSLQLMPDQKACLRTAERLLKPAGEGFLGICDTYDDCTRPASWGLDGLVQKMTQDAMIKIPTKDLFNTVHHHVDFAAVPWEVESHMIALGRRVLPFTHFCLVAPTHLERHYRTSSASSWSSYGASRSGSVTNIATPTHTPQKGAPATPGRRGSKEGGVAVV